MRRTTIHFIVDAFAFVALVAMVSTGFILRYVLPPGSGPLLGEGIGHGSAHKSITFLWGLTRQEWGDIHFWVSIALLAILALHLFLHWRWIASVIRNQPKEHSGVRFGLGVVGVVALFIAAVAPFLSPTRNIPRYRIDNGNIDPQPRIMLRDKVRVHDSMTLRDVERQTGMPVDVLLKELSLPAKISPDSHLGRLSRVYGFDLEEIHRIVDRYEETDGATQNNAGGD